MSRKIDYDLIEKNIETEIYYQDDKIIDILWDSPYIGFGHLTLDKNTKEIIDDEFMSKEFCDIVIKKTKGI